MSESDQINEIEQQLRQLQLSSDTPTKREHEKELHARMQGLEKKPIQQYES